MPIIKLYICDSDISGDGRDVLRSDKIAMKDGLRVIVADELSCLIPTDDGDVDGTLDPNSDLELFTFPVGYDPGDHSAFDIVIDIEAYDYPARLANREDRAKAIRLRFEKLANELGYEPKVAVWLKTVAAGWSSSTAD